MKIVVHELPPRCRLPRIILPIIAGRSTIAKPSTLLNTPESDKPAVPTLEEALPDHIPSIVDAISRLESGDATLRHDIVRLAAHPYDWPGVRPLIPLTSPRIARNPA